MGFKQLLPWTKKAKQGKKQQDEIYSTLKLLQKERIQLCPEVLRAESFVTFIVNAVDPEKNCFELLSLVPNVTPPICDKNLLSLVTLPNSKRNIKFTAKLIDVTNDGLDIFYFECPQIFNDIERRTIQRTRISIGQDYRIAMNDHFGKPLLGTLDDISAHGMRVSFEGDLKQSLRVSKIQRLCNIELEDGQQMECPTEVVYVTYSEEKNRTTLGCRFIELSDEHCYLLFHFISKLQRKYFHRHLE